MLEFGRQVAVDLEADTDFYESRSRPGHETSLQIFACAAY
jgi:hypothetical protein